MRFVVAVLSMSVGVVFIGIASVGVVRLGDVFQRMHAATKAGGIGTSLVVLGVLVAGDTVSPLTGILVIAFMLLTLSVSSQLLARAAYMSGAALKDLHGKDELAGVLDRASESPAARTSSIGEVSTGA